LLLQTIQTNCFVAVWFKAMGLDQIPISVAMPYVTIYDVPVARELMGQAVTKSAQTCTAPSTLPFFGYVNGIVFIRKTAHRPRS
jgi:hypothetical protein